MMMMRTAGLALTWLLLSAGLLACDSSRGAAPASTDVSPSSVILGYSAPMLAGGQLHIHEGLERHANEKGWRVITSTSGGDPEKQLEQIKNFISLRASAIVAVPEDSKGICVAVEAAKAAKTPARVTMDEVGPALVLPTTSVTEKNMNDAWLWANQR